MSKGKDEFLLQWVAEHPGATSWDRDLYVAWESLFGNRYMTAGTQIQRRLGKLCKAGRLAVRKNGMRLHYSIPPSPLSPEQP